MAGYVSRFVIFLALVFDSIGLRVFVLFSGIILLLLIHVNQQIGALLGPFAFSLLLRLTGGYGAGWALCTIPALWVGISLLRQRAPIEQGKALTAKTAG